MAADSVLTHNVNASVTRTPLETVLAYIDRYSAGDADGCWELMALNFARFSGSSAWRPMDRDMFSRWNEGFDDTNWELIDVVANGSAVVCEFLESGTLNRPWPITDDRIVQPNGKTYLNRAIVWFTVTPAGLIDTYRYYSEDSSPASFGKVYGKEIAASGSEELHTPAQAV